MDIEVNHQSKQERSRTRWTPSLDKIFADLVVEQIRLGSRPNNVFDKKTWNQIRDKFNSQTDLNFNNNQLRKHLDVLRTRYFNQKSTFDQQDFSMDVVSFGIGLDLWDEIGAQPKPETVKVKESPIYEQLCTIFSDSGCDGKYARSSHYEELDKSIADIGSSNPDSETPKSKTPPSNFIDGILSMSQKPKKNTADRKRKCPFETQLSTEPSSMDTEKMDAMAGALIEMVAASKSRAIAATMQHDSRFSISSCIKVLDGIQHIDEHLYYAVLDLFENPNLRETFISLKGDAVRLQWLQAKCGYGSCI